MGSTTNGGIMNAKKSKALRRQAEARTKGMPVAHYKRGANGNGELIAGCTRTLYKMLKRVA
jgi:hypothetical protein